MRNHLNTIKFVEIFIGARSRNSDQRGSRRQRTRAPPKGVRGNAERTFNRHQRDNPQNQPANTENRGTNDHMHTRTQDHPLDSQIDRYFHRVEKTHCGENFSTASWAKYLQDIAVQWPFFSSISPNRLSYIWSEMPSPRPVTWRSTHL